ncbi:MAG: signal peptidase I [Gaiellales bacterium]
MGTSERTRQIELNRRRRRNSLKRPPRFLGIARIMRWPRPLGGLLLVVLAYLGAVFWEPLVWVAALVWGLWAAAAVLDAALRGSKGLTAGILATLVGPLGASVVGYLRRRSIRKVPGEGFNWPTTYSLIALALGFVVAGLVLGAALRIGPHGVTVPRAAMGDRIESGDRVLVVPKRYAPVGVGDIVVVDRFKGVDAALGQSSPIAGVGRIVGRAGQVVGATQGRLYLCRGLPDATVGLQPEDECENPSELLYLKTPTPDFGPIRIPPGTWWVMSDDGQGTLIDSRVYGAVPDGAIAGQVVAILTPLERFKIF